MRRVGRGAARSFCAPLGSGAAGAGGGGGRLRGGGVRGGDARLRGLHGEVRRGELPSGGLILQADCMMIVILEITPFTGQRLPTTERAPSPPRNPFYPVRVSLSHTSHVCPRSPLTALQNAMVRNSSFVLIVIHYIQLFLCVWICYLSRHTQPHVKAFSHKGAPLIW